MVIVPRRREHGCRRKLQQIRKALIGSIVLAIALDVVECDAIIVQIALTFTAALAHHCMKEIPEKSQQRRRLTRVESQVESRVERGE